jgi:hypothetical protein
MKNTMLISVSLITLLYITTAFASQVIDVSSTEKLQDSIKLMKKSLSKEQSRALNKAMLYFGLGGVNNIKDIKTLINPDKEKREAIFLDNVQVLKGMSSAEIISKHAEAKTEFEKNKFIKEYQINKDEIQIDKKSYIPNIQITEFVAKRIDTHSDKNVPAVRIGLKNNGNKTLVRVKAVVYFKDASGQVIYEEDFYPVSKFGANKKPLKPNYVYEMRTGQYSIVKSPLSDWVEGEAYIEITDISFE